MSLNKRSRSVILINDCHFVDGNLLWRITRCRLFFIMIDNCRLLISMLVFIFFCLTFQTSAITTTNCRVNLTALTFDTQAKYLSILEQMSTLQFPHCLSTSEDYKPGL